MEINDAVNKDPLRVTTFWANGTEEPSLPYLSLKVLGWYYALTILLWSRVDRPTQ